MKTTLLITIMLAAVVQCFAQDAAGFGEGAPVILAGTLTQLTQVNLQPAAGIDEKAAFDAVPGEPGETALEGEIYTKNEERINYIGLLLPVIVFFSLFAPLF
jgi:hypothetical protein